MLARARRALPCLLALPLLVPGAAEAAKKPKPTCYPKGAKTVRVNEVSRVFKRRQSVGGGLIGTVVYGCDLKTKRRIRLATADYYAPDSYRVTLEGRYVALNYTTSDPADVASGYLRVWSLRGHKRLHSLTDVDAAAMRIGSRGSLAWIGAPLADAGEPVLAPSVHLLDSKGDRAVSSGAVDPSSLAVAGTTVYWTQAGSPFAAKLVP